MEKDVLVKVRGLHIAPDTNSDIPIEVISRGDYYLKNGKHYLFYEEVMEGFNEVTKNRLIFTGDRLEITKSGVTSAHLLFENDKRNSTFYYTPFGSITVGGDGALGEVISDDFSFYLEVTSASEYLESGVTREVLAQTFGEGRREGRVDHRCVVGKLGDRDGVGGLVVDVGSVEFVTDGTAR